MIIKLTLVGLVLILIGVITMTHYTNKEGFDDISNGFMSNLSQDLGNAVNTVSTDSAAAMNTLSTDSAATMNAITGNGTVAQGINSLSDNSTMPIRNEIVPEVSISGTGYDAMNLQQKAELLKDIQKVVKNEVLASRNTTPIMNGSNGNISDSTSQGQEYESSCYKDKEYRCPKNPDGSCPSVPDMSQYIKKDSIPCYGCALDY